MQALPCGIAFIIHASECIHGYMYYTYMYGDMHACVTTQELIESVKFMDRHVSSQIGL